MVLIDWMDLSRSFGLCEDMGQRSMFSETLAKVKKEILEQRVLLGFGFFKGGPVLKWHSSLFIWGCLESSSHFNGGQMRGKGLFSLKFKSLAKC